MEDKENTPEETRLVKAEEMALDEVQIAEQLYNSAGLDPVVNAGLKDFDESIRRENKLLNKVLGPRESDIKGYGESVAKRVAFAVYALLNKQYGGKVGDMRSYIMTLEDERDRANSRYDELMGRVVGILGEEYKQLRTDSNGFMQKLTSTLGEDLRESKIDQKALAESLADIDGLRSRIKDLEEEKKQQQAGYESQIETLNNAHASESQRLSEQIAGLGTKLEELEAEKTALAGDLARLRADHERLEAAVAKLPEAVPYEEIGGRLGEELYAYILKDSKVPDAVIKGVGQFIDFKKYLGLAAATGAEDATNLAKSKLQGEPAKKEPEKPETPE